MKNQFLKWLSTLLIAALLLSPVALMEDLGEAAPSVEKPGQDFVDEAPAEDADDEIVVAEPEAEAVSDDLFEAAVVSEAEDTSVEETEVDLSDADPFASEDDDDDLEEISPDEAFDEDDEIEEEYCTMDPIADSDALFAGYVDILFGKKNDALFASRQVGNDLKGKKKTLYNILKKGVKQIAAGKRASTAFGFKKGGSLSNNDIRKVVLCVIMDYPYETYWFGNAWMWRKSGSKLTLHLSVNRVFSAGTYKVNTATAAVAAASAANARAIAAKYAGLSDYDKLVAYRDEICEAVTYNTDAAKYGTFDLDNNPWQLLWVFDGNPNTNVVCEGYAEAFQYLCDITAFSGNVMCYCVNGYGNGERHRWNIVRMPNGKNYHVDITWCDQEGSGSYDWMFMKAPVSGTYSTGYYFQVNNGKANYTMKGRYIFGEETTSIYSPADLTLSAGNYVDEMNEVPPQPVLPTINVLKKSVKSSVTVGGTYQISLGGAAGRAFKSSRKKVAVVDANGVVTAKAAGKTKITMKVGKKKRTLTLTVVDPTIPTSISLSQSGTIAWYKQDPLTLTATLPEGTNSAIKWSSSNKKVATVVDGVVTFKKTGKVTITATTLRGKKKARVKIKVINRQ